MHPGFNVHVLANYQLPDTLCLETVLYYSLADGQE